MKNLLLLIGISLISFSLFAQTVVQERTSDLMPELYSISGDAILEELSTGSLQLRLSDDFTTPNGPDVRIFLNNTSSSATGGVEIVNLSSIGHFNGGAYGGCASKCSYR